jgi:hypothetical protein
MRYKISFPRRMPLIFIDFLINYPLPGRNLIISEIKSLEGRAGYAGYYVVRLVGS